MVSIVKPLGKKSLGFDNYTEAQTGMQLEVGNAYFLPSECSSVIMPLTKNLKAGDRVVIQKAMQAEFKPLLQIIDDVYLYLDGQITRDVIELDSTVVRNATHERGEPFVFVFNGFAWQSGDNDAVDRAQANRENITVFNVSGNYSVPAHVSRLKVTVIAGGGGGGGGALSAKPDNDHSVTGGAGGGAGGAVIQAVIDVTPNSNIAVVVGSGANGGISGGSINTQSATYGNNGGDGQQGGASSFGSFILVAGGLGGKGGIYARGTDALAQEGGLGGTVTTNTSTESTEYNGGKGGNSGVGSATGNQSNGEDGETVNTNAGGTAFLPEHDRDGGIGGGGTSAHATGGDATDGHGLAGTIAGGGGAGGKGFSLSTGSGLSYNGGKGANGIVIVEWYL